MKTGTVDALDLVGRESELQALHEWFDAGAALVTLVGPGGVGKTRLSRRFAQLRQGDGLAVWSCELAQTRSGPEVIRALAAVLQVVRLGEQSNDEAITSIHDAMVARGPGLLLLDNLEQVIEPVAALLPHWLGTGMSILATSRERVQVQGERVLTIQPLGPDEGVRLFEMRARQVFPEFFVADHERAIVHKIVERLDALPLAIELAASRVDLLDLDALAERLDHRFDLLATKRRDVPSRHATLRAAIDWSWQLLSDAERRTLSMLSVFSGTFDLSAVEAVVGSEGSGPLQSLIEKSLVAVRWQSPRRFALHASIRAYADECLVDPERSDAYGRQARWALELRPRNVEELLAAFTSTRAFDPDLAARLALALDESLSRTGPIDLHEAVLSDACALGCPPALEAELLTAHAFLLVKTYGYVESDRILRALLARMAESPKFGSILLMLARLTIPLRKADGPELLAEAEAVARSRRDPGTLGEVLRARASEARIQGRLDDADRLLAEALALVHELPPEARSSAEAVTREYMSDVAHWRQDADDAFRQIDRFLELVSKDDEVEHARALRNKALLQHAFGKPEAEASFAIAIAACRRVGLKGDAARLLIRTGELHLERGQLERADEFMNEGEREWRAAKHPIAFVAAIGGRALVELFRGRPKSAIDLLSQVRRWMSEAGSYSGYVRQIDQRLGVAWSALGELDRAEKAFRELPERYLLDQMHLETLDELALAHLWVARGRAGVDPAGLAQARALLERVTRGDAPPTRISHEVRLAVLLLDRAMAPVGEARPLRLARDGSWFETPAGLRADLARRTTLKRMLVALADQRLTHPEVPLSTEDVVAAAWPGERLIAEAASNRVYVSVNTLRKLGLEGLLLTGPQGYRLSCDVRFEPTDAA